MATRKKKVPKDDALEVRTGHLNLEPVQISSADFKLHYTAALSNFELAARYAAKYRKNLADAKKVSPQLASAVKLAIKMKNADPEEIKAALLVNQFVLKEVGAPVQITLHDMLLGDVNDVAYKRGVDDQRNGGANKNPYPDNSDLAKEYNRGWDNSVAEHFGVEVPEPGRIGHNSEIEPVA